MEKIINLLAEGVYAFYKAFSAVSAAFEKLPGVSAWRARQMARRPERNREEKIMKKEVNRIRREFTEELLRQIKFAAEAGQKKFDVTPEGVSWSESLWNPNLPYYDGIEASLAPNTLSLFFIIGHMYKYPVSEQKDFEGEVRKALRRRGYKLVTKSTFTQYASKIHLQSVFW